jgi:hypothetical protein
VLLLDLGCCPCHCSDPPSPPLRSTFASYEQTLPSLSSAQNPSVLVAEVPDSPVNADSPASLTGWSSLSDPSEVKMPVASSIQLVLLPLYSDPPSLPLVLSHLSSAQVVSITQDRLKAPTHYKLAAHHRSPHGALTAQPHLNPEHNPGAGSEYRCWVVTTPVTRAGFAQILSRD